MKYRIDQIDIDAPIIPEKGLGGLEIGTNIFALRQRTLEDREQGHLPSQSLVEILKPFLRLLPNARYEIELVAYVHQHFIVRAGLDKETHFKNGKALKTTLTYHYYAGYEPFYLYATQRFLNRNRVTHYESIISQGKEPVPILLRVKEGAIQFVVDGHHKTQAYINQGRPIKAILISKVDDTTMSDEQFK